MILSSTIITSAQDSGLVTAITTQAWLRSGPGTEWRKLEVLGVGTTVALDGHDPSGLWVRGITSGGTVGWMATRYVAATQEQVYALPQIWVDAPFNLAAPAQGAAPSSVPAAPAESAPAPAASGATGGQEVTTTARVNFRSGPGTRYRVLEGLTAGAVLRLDGRNNNGTWARGITASGKIGWVSASYLSASVAGLPVVDISTPFGLAAPTGGGTTSAPATSPLPAPVVNTAPVSGFNYGGHVGEFSEFAANWMRVAGMSWVKRQWRYQQGQDPSAVSGLINDAHARGFRILLGVVGYTWEVNNPGYFDAYAGFVGGVAAQGADAIEVWNEQNIDREWPAGSIDPGRYTQLLAQSYNAIKGANGNTMVISGAPAPTGFFGGCSGNGCDDAPYISGMAGAGAASYMDCVGIHYNEGIIPPGQTSGDPRSEHYTRYFWGMMNTYNNAFGGRRPLCFTELGYLTPEGYGILPGHFGWAQNVTVAQQASWLDQVVSMAGNSGRVRLLIIWNIDYRNFGDDPQGGYAIIRPDGTCPACNLLGS
jgi:uncharacterized protein YraI